MTINPKKGNPAKTTSLNSNELSGKRRKKILRKQVGEEEATNKNKNKRK